MKTDSRIFSNRRMSQDLALTPTSLFDVAAESLTPSMARTQIPSISLELTVHCLDKFSLPMTDHMSIRPHF